jgi:hypothetical protein
VLGVPPGELIVPPNHHIMAALGAACPFRGITPRRRMTLPGRWRETDASPPPDPHSTSGAHTASTP